MVRAAILGSALLLALGCRAKAEVDAAAEKLITALWSSDYDAFEELVHPELAEQMPKTHLARTSRALESLGEPSARSMREFSAKTGGAKSGNYRLSFPDGQLNLELEVLDDQIVSFDIEGEILMGAMRDLMVADAEEFLDAYWSSDYDAFKGLVHPEVVENVRPLAFSRWAQALQMLGKPSEGRLRDISLISWGSSEGVYRLSFPDGELDLELEVLDDKIISFNFNGEIFQKALHALAGSEFRVLSFTFLDGPSDEPKVGTEFAPGEQVPFHIDVGGMTKRGHAVHLVVRLELLAGDGTIVDQTQLIDEVLELDEGAPPAVTTRGKFNAGEPGPYRLRLIVTDKYGERSTSIEQAYTVKASDDRDSSSP